MKKYKVKIRGTAPLLQNSIPDLETITKSGSKHDSPENCESKLDIVDGTICERAIHIEQAMIKCSTMVRVKGQGKKTYKELFKGNVFVTPEMIPHVNQKWKVHKTTVVISATKGRITRYRPMIENWSLEFTVEVHDDRISEDILHMILSEAGRVNGIGDWRPRYGRFVIESFKEV